MARDARTAGWVLSLVAVLALVIVYDSLQRKAPPLPANTTDEHSSSSGASSGGSAVSRNSSAVPGTTGTGRTVAAVTRVVDGDTLHVTIGGVSEKLRIVGIDAPEMNPKECFSDESKARLTELLLHKEIRLEAKSTEDRDVFGRILRYVHLDDADVGLRMVREGFALSYEKYPHELLERYEAAERGAMAAHAGLWGSCAMNASSRSSAAQAGAPPGCAIKGNINADGERIYHLPVCAYYAKTIIDTSQGERWFCSEQEALAAGWRKAGNCP